MRDRRFIAFALLLGCASAPKAAKGPPPWFEKPPTGAAQLYFVGDATAAPNEEMARDLAVQKALANLSNYCGAKIKSDFRADDTEKNGKSEQSVSWTVEISGEELEIREARRKVFEVVDRGDGSFDGYALVEWPKAQYDRVLEAQRNKAKRALERFAEAEKRASALELQAALNLLAEADKALPSGNTIELDDPRHKDSGVLRQAVAALRAAVEKQRDELAAVCAVAIRCMSDGQPRRCADRRVGSLRESVAKAGRKISADAVPDEAATKILDSQSPDVNVSLRNAGCIVAAQFTTEPMGTDSDGFHYVRAGGRVVLFDTASRRVLRFKEAPGEKVGSVNGEDAIKKGDDKTEKLILSAVPELFAR